MFGKQKTRTAEEILEYFKALSEEEKQKVLSALNPSKTEEEAQADETEEHPEEPGEESGAEEQAEEEPADESAGEQERSEADEDLQTAEESEGAEETVTTQEPGVKDDGEDRYQALVARIDALEAMLGELHKAQEDAVEEEHDRDFGMSPSYSEGGEEDDRYNRVMRGYAKGNVRQYI